MPAVIIGNYVMKIDKLKNYYVLAEMYTSKSTFSMADVT